MSATEQYLLFAVAFCLAFLIFSMKKLVLDLKRSEQTVLDQLTEIRRLRWVIQFYSVDARVALNIDKVGPADDSPPNKPYIIDDLPF